MASIPGRVIEGIRSAARIEDVAAEYTTLFSASRGEMKGLCPLHEERTPSFTVSRRRNEYYCFGCAEGGDVFTLVQRLQGLTGFSAFPESARWLADKFGVRIPEIVDKAADEMYRRRLAAREALDAAHARYVAALGGRDPGAATARAWLAARGFSAADAEEAEVGWAPADGRLLDGLDSVRRAGEDAWLIGESNGRRYEMFRARVMWPIRDPHGRIAGFSGRDLGGRQRADGSAPPKYMNTGDTVLFKKGETLLGASAARRSALKERRLIVVEGPTDRMAVQAAGHRNVVVLSGTACTVEQAKLIRSMIGDGGTVVSMLDGDGAGRKATETLYERCQDFADVLVGLLPPGRDPCEVRMDMGDQAIADVIENARPAPRERLEWIAADTDFATPERVAAAVKAAAATLRAVHDDVARERYVPVAARLLSVTERQIADAAGITSSITSTQAVSVRRSSGTSPNGPTDAETALLSAATADPHIWAALVEDPPTWTTNAASAWTALTTALPDCGPDTDGWPQAVIGVTEDPLQGYLADLFTGEPSEEPIGLLRVRVDLPALVREKDDVAERLRSATDQGEVAAALLCRADISRRIADARAVRDTYNTP